MKDVAEYHLQWESGQGFLASWYSGFVDTVMYALI